jgi:hypothetical protein
MKHKDHHTLATRCYPSEVTVPSCVRCCSASPRECAWSVWHNRSGQDSITRWCYAFGANLARARPRRRAVVQRHSQTSPGMARLRAVGAQIICIGASWSGVDSWRVRARVGLGSWRRLGVDLWAGGCIAAGVELGMRFTARPTATPMVASPYRVARSARRQGRVGRDAHLGSQRRCDAIRGKPTHRGRNWCAIIRGRRRWPWNDDYARRRNRRGWNQPILGRPERRRGIGKVGSVHTKR